MSRLSSLKEHTAEDKLQTAISAGIRPIDLGDRGLISQAGIKDDITNRLTPKQQELIKKEVEEGRHHLERQAILSPIFTRLRHMSNADLREAAADFPEDFEPENIPHDYHEAQRYARMIQRGRKDGFAEHDPILRGVPKLATVSGAKELATIRDMTDPAQKRERTKELERFSRGEHALNTVRWFYGIDPEEGAGAGAGAKGGARRKRRTRRSKAKRHGSKRRKSTRRRRRRSRRN